MDRLCNDILLHCFSYVSCHEALAYKRCCPRWNIIATTYLTRWVNEWFVEKDMVCPSITLSLERHRSETYSGDYEIGQRISKIGRYLYLLSNPHNNGNGGLEDPNYNHGTIIRRILFDRTNNRITLSAPIQCDFTPLSEFSEFDASLFLVSSQDGLAFVKHVMKKPSRGCVLTVRELLRSSPVGCRIVVDSHPTTIIRLQWPPLLNQHYRYSIWRKEILSFIEGRFHLANVVTNQFEEPPWLQSLNALMRQRSMSREERIYCFSDAYVILTMESMESRTNSTETACIFSRKSRTWNFCGLPKYANNFSMLRSDLFLFYCFESKRPQAQIYAIARTNQPKLVFVLDLADRQRMLPDLLPYNLLLLVDFVLPAESSRLVADLRLRIVNLESFETRTMLKKGVIPVHWWKWEQTCKCELDGWMGDCIVQGKNIYIGMECDKVVTWHVFG